MGLLLKQSRKTQHFYNEEHGMKKIVSLIMGISLAAGSCFGAAAEGSDAGFLHSINAIFDEWKDAVSAADSKHWMSYDWSCSPEYSPESVSSFQNLLIETKDYHLLKKTYETLMKLASQYLNVPLAQYVLVRCSSVYVDCAEKPQYLWDARCQEFHAVSFTKSNDSPYVRVAAFYKYLMLMAMSPKTFEEKEIIKALEDDFVDQQWFLRNLDEPQMTTRDLPDLTVRFNAEDMKAFLTFMQQCVPARARRKPGIGILPIAWRELENRVRRVVSGTGGATDGMIS